jgi:hypothetical protein
MVMKEKINIAKILKDKPRGTKLYSSACGKCKLEEVDDKSFKISFYNSKFGFMNGGEGYLDKNGKLYDDGECVVFPSKEMRDWEKFAWKRGDVLVNSRGLKILFDRWANDNYTSFYAKTINLVEDGFLDTNLHTLASEKEAKSFIKCIEEKLGGKLNRETLEVEKTQPEFKDGDIVFMKGIKSGYYANCIFILRSEYKDGDERAFYYAFYNTDDKFTIAEYGYTRIHYSLRLATDSEKQQLFDALAKKGKTWDSEKKAIVDLKPKCEFKPFDKVLGRNEKDDVWEAELFSHYREESQYPFRCIGFSRKYCIPYNEDTAHLLGTTDDWEGGEQ